MVVVATLLLSDVTMHANIIVCIVLIIYAKEHVCWA